MIMQGYVNENYEAMLSVVVKNGNKLKSITDKSVAGKGRMTLYEIQNQALQLPIGDRYGSGRWI